MKRIIILLSVFITHIAYAQTPQAFSSDPSQFVKELEDFMKANNNDLGKIAFDIFNEQFSKGNIGADQMDALIPLCNTMLERKMRPTPSFANLLKATAAFVKSGQLPDRYFEWVTMANTILDANKKTNTSFNNFLEFSAPFFEKNALFSNESKTWYFDTFDYQLKNDGEKPSIIFPSLTLYAATKGDTMHISNTSGVYYPIENLWMGNAGQVNWARAGLDSNTVYCTFKKYAISTDKNEYHVDTVTFYDKDFFDKPAHGYFTDKLIVNNTPDKSDYPQFHSFEKTIKLKDVLKNVDYTGGFYLKGRQIIGTGDDTILATVSFRDNVGKEAVKANAKQFLIKTNEAIFADDASVNIVLGKSDSIYHPDIKLAFKADKNTLTLTREDAGASSSPFYSSLHKIDATVDQISWKLDDSTIVFKNITGAGQKSAYFESQDYFSIDLFKGMQGQSSNNPIVILKRYAERNNTREVPSGAFTKELNGTLNVDAVQSILYAMMKEGFIFYDKPHEMLIVKDKTFNYVDSYTKKRDYDVIGIESKNDKLNANLDLGNYELKMDGIYQVGLSDSQYVFFYPDEGKVTMKKNRDMTFAGTVVGGNLDLIGKNFYFSYDTFDIKMNAVDSMIMYVEANKLDDNGNPLYLPVKTSIAVSTGRLQIDKANNKSSKDTLASKGYPIFTSYSFAKADYDKKDVYNNAYDKDKFFFKIDPFTIKDVDKIDWGHVEFNGSMVSGIFPDFREKLKLQSADRSMGFKTETPPGGYPMYDKKGTYNGKIELSNSGLRGTDGKMDFMASTSTSNDLLFFPDSTIAKVDGFVIAKTTKGVEFPSVTNSKVNSIWYPEKDQMIVQQGETPFNFYDGISQLTGNVTVTSKGLTGSGRMDWSDVVLTSNLFNFGAMTMKSDTAIMTIKSVKPDVLALKLQNINANIDFNTKKGLFKSNYDTVMTEMPYNDYKTTMNEMAWDMDAKTLTFKSKNKLSSFYSTNKTQDGLSFQATGGVFDMQQYIINAEGVPFIRVGDASVIPDKGKVTIEADAKMRTLEHATIVADTLLTYHTIKNVTAAISGKNAIKGTGEYEYINAKKQIQIIPIEDIGIKTVKDSVNQITNYQLYAKGYVKDSSNFNIDDKIWFKGPVEFTSQDEFIKFKGYAKLNIADTVYTSTWFKIDDYIDPANPVFSINYAKSENNDSVYAGVFRQYDSTNLYMRVMSKKMYRKDPEIFTARGKCMYDESKGIFYMGNLDKLFDPSQKGTLMTYEDKTGIMHAEGPMDFGLKTDICQAIEHGSIDRNPADTLLRFNNTIAVKIPLPEDIMKSLGELIYGGNAEATFIDYTNSPLLLSAIPEIADEKTSQKLLADLDANGYLQMPKDFPFTLLLTDLKLIWDENTKSFHSYSSKGKIVWFGNQQINQEIKVYVEFGKRNSGDYFNIYLETPYQDFVYITYRKEQMKILTSDDGINNVIFGMDAKKRTVKDDAGNTMVYMLEAKPEVGQFVTGMQDFDTDKETDH